MKPTERFMIEPLLKCNTVCKFCYHLHKKDKWDQYTKPFTKIKIDIDKGVMRGNKYMDITGGEPTIHPDIEQIVSYAKKQGLQVCIITNGMVPEKKTNQLINAGIDEFLVSIHGTKDIHNQVVQTEKARDMQIFFLESILDKVSIRFNCVITKLNQNEFDIIAKWMSLYKPKIVNFINFNPHHQWKDDKQSKEIVSNLLIAEKYLNMAISILEDNGIGVNVRYYPMCRIAQDYRKNICNDLQVMFDPYEWDYCTMPKSIERYFKWGEVTSKNNEQKADPCNKCDLQNICGGGNKYFHAAANEVHGQQFTAQKVQEVRGLDKMQQAYYYRQHANTLEVR